MLSDFRPTPEKPLPLTFIIVRKKLRIEMVVRMRLRMIIMRLHPLATLAPSQAKEIMRKGKFWGVSRAAVRIIPHEASVSWHLSHPQNTPRPTPSFPIQTIPIKKSLSISDLFYGSCCIRANPLEPQLPHLWFKRSISCETPLGECFSDTLPGEIVS